jgi:hypothetical protein
MTKHRLRAIAQRLGLLLGSVIFTLLVIETGYRLFDPFPFIGPEEITAAEHGSLIQYDSELGWKGVPGGSTELITENTRIRLEHNSQGFRDIEHGESSRSKPAIIFLGDSFMEGYEVSFEEMFVNRLRSRLKDHTIINLGLRGYGTDQQLITFRNYSYDGPLEWVVLMFSDNDVDDNNSNVRYAKFKPMYRLVQGRLELTGVPVPRSRAWTAGRRGRSPHLETGERLRRLFLRVHFINDVLFRYNLRRHPRVIPMTPFSDWDLTLTAGILRELKREVGSRGAELTVVTVPSKIEIDKLNDWPPYQTSIAELCLTLDIDYLDLSPDFRRAWLRTYYRHGGHWNARGHRIATVAIARHLKQRLGR